MIQTCNAKYQIYLNPLQPLEYKIEPGNWF